MKYLFFVLLSLSLGCAHSQKQEVTDTDKYVQQISGQLEPILKTEVRTQVQNLAKQGLKPIPLRSPENELLVGISISKTGEIKNIQPLKKSKYVFLNDAATKVLQSISPLPPPPASCLKEDICKVSYKFVAE